MQSIPFSLRLDPAVKARLEREARIMDSSASYVATQAIQAFLDARESREKAIADALAQADMGVFVSQEAIAGWMNSWGTKDERPPPEPDVFPPKRRRAAKR